MYSSASLRTAERAAATFADGAFDRRTGAGYVSHREGDYARAQAAGVECVPLLVETFGGMSPALYDALREASDWRANKLP